MKERPYQRLAIENTVDAWNTHASVLVVMPTGCIAADSVLGINRGGKGYSRSIGMAFEKQCDPRRRNDISTMVRSHVGDRIGLHRVAGIVDSGIKQTHSLMLANGKNIRATADHEVLTENGFVAIGALRADRVVCETVAAGRLRKPKLSYRAIQGLIHHPHAMGVEARTRANRKPEGRLYRVAYHRLVAEAVLNELDVEALIGRCRNGDVAGLRFLDPAVFAVHHRDGNHKNNAPENLQVLTHEDHHRLHGTSGGFAHFGFGALEASEVVAVMPFGSEQTYDVVCDDPHRNFVANGIVVHNCGKTIVAAHLIGSRVEHGRVMFIAHREELIFQARDRIERVSGTAPSVEMAEMYSDERGMYGKSLVVVSSVQTQCRGRMDRFDPNEFSLLVIDEAHHATADTYRRTIDHYRKNSNLRVLGLTATPDRYDEEALGQVFEHVSFDYEILDAIHDGWLVPIQQKFVSVDGLDYSGVHTVANDFNQGELAAVLEDEDILHRMAIPTMEIAGDRKTLVFAASVAHAGLLTDILNRYKPDSAFVITGKTDKDERRALLDAYRSNKFQFMINVGVATEGFDMPDVEIVVMGRPTKSRALYAQMCGRATRPLTGLVDDADSAELRRERIEYSEKPNMLVLDFVGNSGRHKLMTTADILGGRYSDREIDRANQIIAAGEEADTKRALDKAKKLIEHEDKEAAQRERRKPIRATANYGTVNVDPFEMLDIVPHAERAWNGGRLATEKQVALLEKFGLSEPEKLSFDRASQLINELIRRREEQRCTFKQAKILRRYGYGAELSFAEASAKIDAIAKNGWRRPAEVNGVTDRVATARRMDRSELDSAMPDLH